MCCARPNGLKTDTGHGVDEATPGGRARGRNYGTMTRRAGACAFRHCTGEEGLAIIDGQAGTGKSFTMARDPRCLRGSRASRDRPRPDQ